MRKGYCLVLCLLLCTVHAKAKEEEEIQGSNIVEIAVQGESIALYDVPEGYQIQLKEMVSGVHLESSGKLVVSKEANAQTITLIADNGESKLTFEVELVSSWTMQVVGAENYQIPDPETTRKINYMDEIKPYLPIQGIWIVGVSIALFVWLRYQYIRRKARR